MNDRLLFTDEENKNDSRSPSRLLVLLERAFQLVSLFLLGYSIYLVVLRDQLWFVNLGYVSAVTVGCMGGIMLVSEYCFSHYDKMDRIDAMVFSVLFAAAFVWSYEIIYYLSFPQDLWVTSIPQLGEAFRTVALAGIQLLPIILLRKKLCFGRLSVVLLALFSTMWIFWILYGFPQYYTPNYLGWTMYPKILVASDPYHTSLFFNFGSKSILGIFFISLVKFPCRRAIKTLVGRIVSLI